MKSSITLSDSPSVVTYGSDGAFLNLSGESASTLQFSMGLTHCHPSEGKDQSSTCPNRRVCNQILSEWYERQGRYQRPDVTGYDRLEIAQRVKDSERLWGEVTDLAQKYNLSRPTIYDIGERVSVLFEPRKPGPMPCIKRLLPCGGTDCETEAEGPSPEEEKRMRNRLILTSLFPGGVTMRPMEEILEETPLVKSISATTIWRFVNREGPKAYLILNQVDYANVCLPVVWVDVDETFFDGRPILFAVEPISLSICGFHVPSDGDRSSYTWGPLLLILQEDQHLDIQWGVGDAATPYPSTFEAVLEQKDHFQEDIFHPLRDMQTLRRKLENGAYRTFATEYKVEAKHQKENTLETQESLGQAKTESLDQAELHDSFEEYISWVSDAFEIVDLRSGEIRDREINGWLLDEAIAGMAQLNHPDVVKMSERLKNHKKRLLLYLDWLETRLLPLQADLHAYLDDLELEKALSQIVARYWYLQHQVESMQNRAFRPAMELAEQELAILIEGDAFLKQWSQEMFTLLELVQRASSAVENINSIFKPLVTRKKHFASSDTALNYVALFVLWHNMRVFKEGKRKGHSPFEILGIDLGVTDWRTLLGYLPVQ